MKGSRKSERLNVMWLDYPVTYVFVVPAVGAARGGQVSSINVNYTFVCALSPTSGVQI